MGIIGPKKGKRKKVQKVKIEYPQLNTRKWIPPDLKPHKKKPKKIYPPYPPELHSPLKWNLLKKVWHHYKRMHNCAILLGNHTIFNHKYHYRSNGYQGASVCVVAVLFSKLTECCYWNSRMLDHIVDIGNHYCLSSQHQQGKRIIKLQDLNKNIYLHNTYITLCLKDKATYKGLLYKDVDNNKDYLANILEKFFQENQSGVLSTAGHIGRHFALWVCGGGYFLFDPTDHDDMCWPWKDLRGRGFSFLIRFPNVAKMIQVIHRNLPETNVEFEITPITIQCMNTINTIYPYCLLDYVEEEKKKPTCIKPPPPAPPEPPKEKVEEEEEEDMDSFEDNEDENPAEDQPESPTETTKKKKKRKMIVKPRVESTTYFNIVVPERIGILLAETHQCDDMFTKCASNKSICNAVAALVMLRENKAKHWTSKILTNVLRLGYRICVESTRLLTGDQELKLETIEKMICFNDKCYTSAVTKYGAVGKLKSTDETHLDLLPALKEVLSECDTLILQGPLTVAIWKEADLFYMFDPNERDPNGFAVIKEIRVGSVMEAVDFISGTACLTWYRDLRDLVDMYMKNVEYPRRKEQFILSNVEIRNYVALPENWRNFKSIESDRWIIHGTIAQSNRLFERATRNTQCTANCAMAIAFIHLYPLTEWTCKTIDDILKYGNEYYKQCVNSLEKREKFKSNMLLISELDTETVVDDKLIIFDFDECTVNGLVSIPENYKEALNLQQGLENFFQDHDYGILTCRGISVAIWRRGEAFFYFDSHDRNEQGFYAPHGSACVQRITNLKKTAECIMANLGPESVIALYNINKVEVQIFNPPPPDAPLDEDDIDDMVEPNSEDEEDDLISKFNVERPLYNYLKITKKRAILRSRYDQSNEIFGVNAGRQTIPNLLAVIAMSRVFNPAEWTVDLLDEVLYKGKEIYDLSLEDYYKAQASRNIQETEDTDENDDITTENVHKEFKIGVNRFTVSFEELEGGILGDDCTEIKETIKQMFKKDPEDINDFKELIIHTDTLDFVIWEHQKLYYLFDPRARDDKGQVYGREEWSPPITEDVVEPMTEDLTDYMGEEFEGDEKIEAITNLEPPDEDEIENFLVEEWREFGEDIQQEEESEYVPPIIKHSQSYWDALEKEYGRACIIWFTKPKYLIKHIINNNPPKLRKDGEYKLIKVTMKNELDMKDVCDPSTCPQSGIGGNWYEFQEITRGEWILRGTLHYKSDIFPDMNKGKQADAMNLVALGYVSLYEVGRFDKYTVDQILKYGDRLYTYTRRLRRQELQEINEFTPGDIDEILNIERYNLDQLVKKYCVGDNSVTVHVGDDVVSGEVHAQEVEDEFDVKRGIDTFFLSYQFGILSSKGESVAIWNCGKFYYMFDCANRGPHGYGFENGVSCITRFIDSGKMAELFIKNLPRIGKNFFTIRAIGIEMLLCMKPERVEMRCPEDPLKIIGFKPIMAGKLMVRGTTHQDDIKFGRGTNAQCSPIAFVALAMSLIHSSEYWTKSIVDDIIRIGDGIYGEILDRCDFNFNPWEEKLTVAMTPPDFRIGKIKVNCELRHTIQQGIIDIVDSNILNLRQGIKRFFEENSYGVIETDFLTVAIWQSEDPDSNYIYMFDPNPRGPTGQPMQEGGTAAVMKFCGAELMAGHIISLVHSERDGPFLITPVEIVLEYNGKKKKTKRFGEERPIPKQTETSQCQKLGRHFYYVIPRSGMEIIRGYRSQYATYYSEFSRGNQDVCNCIISYIVDKLIPICQWNYKTIHMILDAGDQLYKDSYMVYNPKNPKLRLETLIRDIILQDVRVKIAVGAPVLTAKFDEALLTEALQACFNLKSFCIVLVDDNAISIFKKEEWFYIYYPNDINLHGLPIEPETGSSAAIRFKSLEQMICVMLDNVKNSNSEKPEIFHVIVVAVKEIEKVPPGTTFLETTPNIIKQEPQLFNCDKTIYGHPKEEKAKANIAF